jgi:hypothetical protein
MVIVPSFWRALWIPAIIVGHVTVQPIGSTLVVPKAVADRTFSGKEGKAERIFMCILLMRIFAGRWDFPKGVA